MSHLCRAVGCTIKIDPRHWGCSQHWAMVPREVVDKIVETYRPGQESGQPTREFWYWSTRAQLSVAEQEGLTDHAGYHAAHWYAVNYERNLLQEHCPPGAPAR